MRSPKEVSLDNKIISAVSQFSLTGKAEEAAKLILGDDEIQAMQEYANVVSIKRLNYNDHGPVHMRTVALNCVIMSGLLKKAGITTSLEREECGTFEDSLVAMLLSASLHDLGMTIGRQDHELHSAYLSYPIIDRILREVYPDDIQMRVIVRSLAIEGIAGHMGGRTVHSLEAGVILIADGCDMKKGRARIPMAIANGPKVGDIHKYSANSIEDVLLSEGKEKPIRIEVLMSSEVGLFQVEEVLLGKIAASTVKNYVELYAVVENGAPKRYM
ncbi:phosphohydrolase [Breznakiella homolactica]|uniref:Phosphohydrolase n=1 Tax=Breznakiella homolactica TaxID=2798577 RepID=A0A7T7XMS2_9SPIR|nr:phosphohydrolase [Breznakiella homolactica]QQO09225.1 phosphohydrolase [Breznakiella homolactica]